MALKLGTIWRAEERVIAVFSIQFNFGFIQNLLKKKSEDQQYLVYIVSYKNALKTVDLKFH